MTRIAALMFVWTVAQVFRNGSSLRTDINFRCDNGRYIDNSGFCDGGRRYNCYDRSDELFGCSEKCGAGKFDCGADEPCINIKGRCNTHKECPGGKDEINCGNETDIEHCSLHEGRYLCHDRLKCIEFKYTCDGSCNCFDCSDETYYCYEPNNSSCTSCSAYCLRITPIGPQCTCNSTQYKTSKFCIENFSSANGQTCSRLRDSILCECHENHHEIHQLDGIKCRNNVWLEQILIYSTAGKIKKLNITTNNPPQIIQDDVNCTILTAAKDHLYYAAYRDKKERIFKTAINGGKSEKITELNSTIKSLAVDWISGNLYFTSNNSLFVCSNDGRICTRLKCCGVDYVALAPKFGWMFYVRNEIGDTEQLIMKSNMDGSEEKNFIDMTFNYSTSIAIDEWAETIYCFEMEGMLYSFFLNGSKIIVSSLSKEGFQMYFSILERYAFFMKKNDNKIYNTTISDWNHFTIRKDEGTTKIRNLFTYNPLIQFTYEIENPCTATSCTGICLLRADSDSNGLNYTCKCENFVPSDDNSWCDDHPSNGYFNIITCLGFALGFALSFAFGILMLRLLIRNETIKRRPTVNLSERIELKKVHIFDK